MKKRIVTCLGVWIVTAVILMSGCGGAAPTSGTPTTSVRPAQGPSDEMLKHFEIWKKLAKKNCDVEEAFLGKTISSSDYIDLNVIGQKLETPFLIQDDLGTFAILEAHSSPRHSKKIVTSIQGTSETANSICKISIFGKLAYEFPISGELKVLQAGKIGVDLSKAKLNRLSKNINIVDLTFKSMGYSVNDPEVNLLLNSKLGVGLSSKLLIPSFAWVPIRPLRVILNGYEFWRNENTFSGMGDLTEEQLLNPRQIEVTFGENLASEFLLTTNLKKIELIVNKNPLEGLQNCLMGWARYYAPETVQLETAYTNCDVTVSSDLLVDYMVTSNQLGEFMRSSYFSERTESNRKWDEFISEAIVALARRKANFVDNLNPRGHGGFFATLANNLRASTAYLQSVSDTKKIARAANYIVYWSSSNIEVPGETAAVYFDIAPEIVNLLPRAFRIAIFTNPNSAATLAAAKDVGEEYTTLLNRYTELYAEVKLLLNYDHPNRLLTLNELKTFVPLLELLNTRGESPSLSTFQSYSRAFSSWIFSGTLALPDLELALTAIDKAIQIDESAADQLGYHLSDEKVSYPESRKIFEFIQSIQAEDVEEIQKLRPTDGSLLKILSYALFDWFKSPVEFSQFKELVRRVYAFHKDLYAGKFPNSLWVDKDALIKKVIDEKWTDDQIRDYRP